MLKALQILGSSSSSSISSSGLVSSFPQRLKLKKKKKNKASLSLHLPPNSVCGSTKSLAISTNTISLSSSSRKATAPLLVHDGHCCSFRASGVSSVHDESIPDGPSSSSSATIIPSTGGTRKINFCQSCGGPTKYEKPDGEDKMRAICTVCGKIAYENPKMVVGCLIEHEDKILLCRRKIQPSYGLWTLPAGYMEIGESATDGAIRETWEEANAEVDILCPFAQLDIPLIGQTYIIFLAKLKRPHFSPGQESLECRLFALDDIPFDSLAFSSMLITLKLYIEDRQVGRAKFHYGVINKRPGSSPSDIHAYTLDHLVKS